MLVIVLSDIIGWRVMIEDYGNIKRCGAEGGDRGWEDGEGGRVVWGWEA